jgi:hypothetical protein
MITIGYDGVLSETLVECAHVVYVIAIAAENFEGDDPTLRSGLSLLASGLRNTLEACSEQARRDEAERDGRQALKARVIDKVASRSATAPAPASDSEAPNLTEPAGSPSLEELQAKAAEAGRVYEDERRRRGAARKG